VRSPYPVNPNVVLTRLLDFYGRKETQETSSADTVRKVSNILPQTASSR
jgi:hypothetical protein|tara:strand:- start:515 stop:661 length:147 start_codon:yes stop_codon:yes gene_type:complete